MNSISCTFLADQIEAELDGRAIPIIRHARFDEPLYVLQTEVDPQASHSLTLKIKRKYKTISLHPQRHNLNLQCDGKKVSFEFTGAPYLVLECDALGYVVLLFEKPEQPPEGDGVLQTIQPDPEQVQTAAIQAALDKVSSSKMLHTLRLTQGIYRSGDLNFPSNVRLHLDEGAVLRASDHAEDLGDPTVPGHHKDRACFLHADGSEHIAITGLGIIDGNRFVLDNERYFKGLLRFMNCRHVTFEGITFLDSCGWGVTPRNCEHVLAERVKILNNRPLFGCINTDGLNPDSCRHVRIQDCFFHTGDDAVAVKSSDYGQAPADVNDIRVSGLLAINNSATAKIGTETCAENMEDIHFEYIDAVRTCRLVVVEAFDVAHIQNISFKHCSVHKLDDAWDDAALVDLSAPKKAFRPIAAKATITDVLLEDIHSLNPAACRVTHHMNEGFSSVQGLETKNISNATWQDIQQ